MEKKFRRKSNGEILTYDDVHDVERIKSLRMSKKFQELIKI